MTSRPLLASLSLYRHGAPSPRPPLATSATRHDTARAITHAHATGATHGDRPARRARGARAGPRRHGHGLPRRERRRRGGLRAQGLRQALPRGSVQAVRGHRRGAARAVGGVRAVQARAPAPAVPARLRRDARPAGVGTALLPRRGPERAPPRAARPRVLPRGHPVLRRRGGVRARRAPRRRDRVPRPQARERAPPRRRPRHADRLRPLAAAPAQVPLRRIHVHLLVVLGDIVSAATGPEPRPEPAPPREEHLQEKRVRGDRVNLRTGGTAQPRLVPEQKNRRRRRPDQEGEVGQGVADGPRQEALELLLRRSSGGAVVLVRGHRGVRCAGGGARRRARVRGRLVGARGARLRDVPRADAVPGPGPEGDVPERAAPGAGVHGGRAAAVAGADGPHREAAGEGPCAEAGFRRRRRRGPGAPVLRRGGVGPARGGVPAALHSRAGR
uniref:Uncharacterized protein n=1 Tax=Zea mays TaxID=4577 RepID=A0A804QBI5_MAIZE